MKLKFALMCGPENGSPKVLAETLEKFIVQSGHTAKVYYQVKAFKRLLSHQIVKYNRLIWMLYKAKNLVADRKLFSRLRAYDAVIICDWTPNGFYRDTYNIDKLKSIIKGKPILYYAVQFLQNSPTIIEKLSSGGHASLERYDWHLAVSSITEKRGIPAPPWSQIGMHLRSTGLQAVPKEEFFAIVDFLRPGYENYREIQKESLDELGIPYISLETEYSVEDIRAIYKKASIFFLQFPEAFGLPIAECLASGCYIGTPESSWAMSWRLDEEVEVHGPGRLPECFIVYEGKEDLKKQLLTLREEFDSVKTPEYVFEVFYRNYPSFYDGNQEALNDVFSRISEQRLNADSQ
jgi:hypothetical protein